MAGLAIVFTIPAIYLPFCLQNIYHRVTALITYKLKDFKIITILMKEKKENEYNRLWREVRDKR